MGEQKVASSKIMIGYKVNIHQYCDHFDYNFKVKVDKQEIQFHVPWLGFFEHLDSINIESIAKK